MSLREEYIKNIRLSSVDVFAKITGEEKIEVVPNPGDSSEMDISSTISLTGPSSGLLITVGIAEAGASEFAVKFLKSKTALPDALVKSSICELVNIIAGDFKKRQMLADFKLGLPQLIEGNGHKILQTVESVSYYHIEYIFSNYSFKQFVQFSSSFLNNT